MDEKSKKIRREELRFMKVFSGIEPEKKTLVNGLIQNAAFMHITLLELQNEVLEHGAMIQATSGNGFETIKDNPAQKAYTTMISRYAAVIDQLTKLLPKDDNAVPGEELMEFING